MKLAFCVDDSQLEPQEITRAAATLLPALSTWCEQSPCPAQALGLAEDEPLPGLTVEVRRKADLKAPLTLLYPLAKQLKIEFSVNIVDPDSGAFEEVCYFGFEEGKPDAFEIANYIGL